METHARPEDALAQPLAISITTRSLAPTSSSRGQKSGKFDYDRPLEGLKTIDRYMIQLKLTRPDYIPTELMQQYNWSPVAREVVRRIAIRVAAR